MFNFNMQKKQAAPIESSPYRQENQAVPKTEEEAPQNEYVNRRISEIDTQAREFLEKNPDFNVEEEFQNSTFVKYLIKNELSVEDAYFLTHRDEIMDTMVKNTLARISSRKNRITENGAGKNSPASVKKNPKDMSDKEIDSIIERVNNGEKISF